MDGHRRQLIRQGGGGSRDARSPTGTEHSTSVVAARCLQGAGAVRRGSHGRVSGCRGAAARHAGARCGGQRLLLVSSTTGKVAVCSVSVFCLRSSGVFVILGSTSEFHRILVCLVWQWIHVEGLDIKEIWTIFYEPSFLAARFLVSWCLWDMTSWKVLSSSALLARWWYALASVSRSEFHFFCVKWTLCLDSFGR